MPRLTCLAALAALAFAAPAAAGPYVIMGPDGVAVARTLSDKTTCPNIRIDGRDQRMTMRASAATLPQRPTQSLPELSKPSAFPAAVCEAALPPGTRTASIAGRALPLPPGEARRIVVIGDTGCRLKASEQAFQDCNDGTAYPFAKIAGRAAAWKPDMVVHVGDLLYRENPCPAARTGCQGSPWGYGLDAWRADFFDPAAPLLAAAPWVMVRGNHENCSRAGQGWWRMIDPRPLEAGRDCIDPTNDSAGDWSPPYAVPLGGNAQLVVMDLAIAGTKAISPADPRIPQFRQSFTDLARLAQGATFTFAADHYPILGYKAARGKDDGIQLEGGNDALTPTFANSLPNGVDVLLSGHVHLWEQVGYASRHPSQFIAGFSGTDEDVIPLPDALPEEFAPAPGARIEHASHLLFEFGYMTLERTGARQWHAEVWDKDGRAVRVCAIDGRRSACDRP